MTHTSISADQAWSLLLEGNQRFVAGQPIHWHQSLERRKEVVAGQHPFAIVLTCSDSRVPPEILFDQGIGDIFVVRTAGNVADDVALGSIEYAAEHLGVQLVVVLGHQKCGAVAATVQGGAAPGHLPSIVRAIQPAVEQTRGQGGDHVDNAVRANVGLIVAQLRTCQPILAELAHAGHLQVVGAYYSLETGAVSLI